VSISLDGRENCLDEAERRGFFPRRGLRPGEEKNGYEGRTSLAGQTMDGTGRLVWFDLMPAFRARRLMGRYQRKAVYREFERGKGLDFLQEKKLFFFDLMLQKMKERAKR